VPLTYGKLAPTASIALEQVQLSSAAAAAAAAAVRGRETAAWGAGQGGAGAAGLSAVPSVLSDQKAQVSLCRVGC